jgi:hypothetical protein
MKLFGTIPVLVAVKCHEESLLENAANAFPRQS